MEINREITVRLTTDDLREIIIEHLKSKNVDIKSIHFKVSGHEAKGDWFSELPLDYRLDEVVCKGVEYK